ncbi:hypothetical protein CKY20_07030 [Capnocytophaga canis]|uniref:DUF2752 domain-containing protein n=1 Tax=Capnocytophaga canis TaxID=1848903 RepID=A0A3A1YG20_9FLAO|nr:hypothetical protein CKY20_07030 [Capnocytophaga canis]
MSKIWFYLKNGVVVTIPIVLMFLPADYFDRGQSVCLSKTLAGIECWGCGLTRAIMHFIHFEFEEAWMFNKLVVIVVPLLFVVWIRSLFSLLGVKSKILDRI